MNNDNIFWWEITNSKELRQGDWLQKVYVPIVPEAFDPASSDQTEIVVEERDIIIITQSCDLEQGKAPFVASCPIHTLQEWESVNPKYKSKGKWDEVRRGRIEGLHMLAGLPGPNDNLSSLVVDFRQIFSIPIGYLQNHANNVGDRSRLVSPYLEHLAQAFARFFMRVGLPSSIKEFK